MEGILAEVLPLGPRPVQRAPPTRGPAARHGSSSTPSSALMDSDGGEEAEGGWGGAAPPASQQAGAGAWQLPPPQPQPWAALGTSAAAPQAAPPLNPPLQAALAAVARWQPDAAQPVRPVALPANGSRLEALRRCLSSGTLEAQPAPQPADPLSALLASLSSTPAENRQQLAGLLEQLAELLDQQARAATTQALLHRLQQQIESSQATLAALGGGPPPAAPPPTTLAQARSAPLPGADHPASLPLAGAARAPSLPSPFAAQPSGDSAALGLLAGGQPLLGLSPLLSKLLSFSCGLAPSAQLPGSNTSSGACENPALPQHLSEVLAGVRLAQLPPPPAGASPQHQHDAALQ